MTSREDKDLRTIFLSLSSLESSVFSHLTEKSSCIQQNFFDQSSSSNKRLRLTIEERSKDVENAESFEEINTDFDEEVDEEDLCTEDISTIEDQ